MISRAKRSKYEVTQLIGQDDAKLTMYLDPACPQDILLKAVQSLYEKEFLSKSDCELIHAIARNSSTPEEALSYLDKISYRLPSWIQKDIKQHINHPEGQSSLLQRLDSYSNYQSHFYNIIQKNEDLHENLTKNCYLSGNSIASLLNNVESNDFDFFFKTKESAMIFLKYILTLSKDLNGCTISEKSNGLYIEGLPKILTLRFFNYEVIITKNAVTFTRQSHFPQKIQFITRVIGTPDVVTSNFDFAHCKMYMDLNLRKFVFPPEAVFAAQRKFIIVGDSIANPLNAMIRLKKFLKRSFSVSACEVVKLGYQLSKLDFSDSAVIIDGLNDYYGEPLEEFLEKELKDQKNITYQDLLEFSRTCNENKKIF